MHKQRILILVAAVLGIVSVFLPWEQGSFSIGGFTSSVSVKGMDYGYAGWFSLGLFGLAGILTLMGDPKIVLNRVMKKAVAGVGAGALAFMIVVLLSIGFGWASSGIYLSILGALSVMALPIIIQGDGSFKMPTNESLNNDLK